MKIGTLTRKANGQTTTLKVFRPCQVLLFKITKNIAQDVQMEDFLNIEAKLNASLQDSKTGSQTTVIPYAKLNHLAEIATIHEGLVVMEKTFMLLPVLLNPVGSLKIDNDKYLEIELSDLDVIYDVEVYGFEAGVISERICVYQKFSVPAGTARQTFVVGSNDVLSLPTENLSSVRLTYASGIVSDLTPVELSYLMSKTNDLTVFRRDSLGRLTQEESQITVDVVGSYAFSYVIDLVGVTSFEILRDTVDYSAPYEFFMADLQ